MAPGAAKASGDSSKPANPYLKTASNKKSKKSTPTDIALTSQKGYMSAAVALKIQQQQEREQINAIAKRQGQDEDDDDNNFFEPETMCTTQEELFRIDRSKLPDGVIHFDIIGYGRAHDYVILYAVGFYRCEPWCGTLRGTLAKVPPVKLHKQQHEGVMAQNQYKHCEPYYTGTNGYDDKNMLLELQYHDTMDDGNWDSNGQFLLMKKYIPPTHPGEPGVIERSRVAAPVRPLALPNSEEARDDKNESDSDEDISQGRRIPGNKIRLEPETQTQEEQRERAKVSDSDMEMEWDASDSQLQSTTKTPKTPKTNSDRRVSFDKSYVTPAARKNDAKTKKRRDRPSGLSTRGRKKLRRVGQLKNDSDYPDPQDPKLDEIKTDGEIQDDDDDEPPGLLAPGEESDSDDEDDEVPELGRPDDSDDEEEWELPIAQFAKMKGTEKKGGITSVAKARGGSVKQTGRRPSRLSIKGRAQLRAMGELKTPTVQTPMTTATRPVATSTPVVPETPAMGTVHSPILLDATVMGVEVEEGEAPGVVDRKPLKEVSESEPGLYRSAKGHDRVFPRKLMIEVKPTSSSSTVFVSLGPDDAIKDDDEKVRYRCDNHRNECKCKARAVIMIVTRGDGKKDVVTEAKGTHSGKCLARAISVQKREGLDDVIEENVNLERSFKNRVEEVASKELHLTPAKVYATVRDEFLEKNKKKTLSLPCTTKMYNAVNNRRKEIYGEAGDVSKLVLHHMVNRKQSSFHEADTWVDDKGVQSNLIFGNPHLFHLLKYPKLRVHIDATFKVCPRTHLQCLIWSIQDKGSEMHIPIFYVLMTTKSQEAYERALTSIKHISGVGEFDILTLMHDFEDAIINACRKILKCQIHRGCYFHWLKALREKLEGLGMDKDLRTEIVNLMRFLTVVEVEDLDYALEWVIKKSMKLRGARKQKELVNIFFHYFRETWMTSRLKNFWNYTGVEDWAEKIVQRTNNMLECYNKEFAKIFGRAHPPLVQFAQSVHDEGIEWRTRLDGANSNYYDLGQDRRPIRWPVVPQECREYIAAKKSG